MVGASANKRLKMAAEAGGVEGRRRPAVGGGSGGDRGCPERHGAGGGNWERLEALAAGERRDLDCPFSLGQIGQTGRGIGGPVLGFAFFLVGEGCLGFAKAKSTPLSLLGRISASALYHKARVRSCGCTYIEWIV